VSLETALAGALEGGPVLTDPALTASYETDWTGAFSGRARCVVSPATADAVGRVLRVCASYGVGVVVQGGNTGLVGGSVPGGGEVVLSTRKLCGLGPVDPVARQVTAGAGVPLAQVQRAARGAGLSYGIDFAARDSATIGGTVATNAGGVRVLAHGTTRAQVLGVEAVLADGSVLRRLGGLAKDATGYDLAALLTGSEGTLAVLTAVRLRLLPPDPPLQTALVGLAGLAEGLVVLSRVPDLHAAEVMDRAGVSLVCAVAGLAEPLPAVHPAYLLIEAPDLAALADLAGPGELDAVVAADGADRARLWAYRERHSEAIATRGVPVKLDVALPLAALPAFAAELPGVLAAGTRRVVFGHLGDGNLHVNLLGAAPSDADAVLRLVAACGGSIGAEHGVGRAKVSWLHLSRSPAEIAAMRAVKAALDPGGLLNPGVLLPT